LVCIRSSFAEPRRGQLWMPLWRVLVALKIDRYEPARHRPMAGGRRHPQRSPLCGHSAVWLSNDRRTRLVRLPTDTYRRDFRNVENGCPDATEQLNKATRKTENERIRKGHSRSAGATVTVALEPRRDRFETENQEGCASRRKWAWMQQKRQNPGGFNPRGLVLTKNRQN